MGPASVNAVPAVIVNGSRDFSTWLGVPAFLASLAVTQIPTSPALRVARSLAPATSPSTARAYHGFMRIDCAPLCSRCFISVLRPAFLRIYPPSRHLYGIATRPCPFLALEIFGEEVNSPWPVLETKILFFSGPTSLRMAPMVKPLLGKRPNEEAPIDLCPGSSIVRPRPMAPCDETSSRITTDKQTLGVGSCSTSYLWRET